MVDCFFAKKRHFFCLLCMLFLTMNAAADENTAPRYAVRLPECVDRSSEQRFQMWCEEINKILVKKIEDNPAIVFDESAPFSVSIACMDTQDGVLLTAKISEIETENVLKSIRLEASAKRMEEAVDSFTGEIVSFIENGFVEKTGGQITGTLLGFEGVGSLFRIGPGVGGQLQILWGYGDMQLKQGIEAGEETEEQQLAFGISAGAIYYFNTTGDDDVLQITVDAAGLLLWPELFGIPRFRMLVKLGAVSIHTLKSDSVKSLWMVHTGFGVQLGGALDEDETVLLYFSPSVDLGYYYDTDIEEMALGFFSLNLGLTLYFDL